MVWEKPAAVRWRWWVQCEKCEWEHVQSRSRERRKMVSSASQGGGISLALQAACRQARGRLGSHRQSCTALSSLWVQLCGSAFNTLTTQPLGLFSSLWHEQLVRTPRKTFFPRIIFEWHLSMFVTLYFHTASNLPSPWPATQQEHFFLSLQQFEPCSSVYS